MLTASSRFRAAMVAGSIALSLVIAELGASALHRGAFPYLNLFVSDARYGVRLRPSSTARVRSRTGRVTEIRTSSLGFRGLGEWDAAGGPRVLLLGDSQMLGYGVAEEEAVAARLSEITGARVLTAAVPSWGPAEYTFAVEDLAPRLRPDVVVFVANLANDWGEAAVPNVKRSDAADGWLTRRRADEPPRTDFPGREWLLGRSHLVFAVREAWALFGRGSKLAGLPAASAAERLLEQLPELSRAPSGSPGLRSRIGPHLADTAFVCRSLCCDPIAAALPVDVLVHPGEWAKYRTSGEARDLGPAESLLTDFLADAAKLGVAGVNLLGPLREASPGAFLPDDFHLSARGHERVARALAPLVVGALNTKKDEVTRCSPQTDRSSS